MIQFRFIKDNLRQVFLDEGVAGAVDRGREEEKIILLVKLTFVTFVVCELQSFE